MLNVLTFQTDRPMSLAQKKKFNFQRSVRDSYYTVLSYDVIHDVFVLFTFKRKLKWFGIAVWQTDIGYA